MTITLSKKKHYVETLINFSLFKSIFVRLLSSSSFNSQVLEVKCHHLVFQFTGRSVDRCHEGTDSTVHSNSLYAWVGLSSMHWTTLCSYISRKKKYRQNPGKLTSWTLVLQKLIAPSVHRGNSCHLGNPNVRTEIRNFDTAFMKVSNNTQSEPDAQSHYFL
jgi:hypothetical protein